MLHQLIKRNPLIESEKLKKSDSFKLICQSKIVNGFFKFT